METAWMQAFGGMTAEIRARSPAQANSSHFNLTPPVFRTFFMRYRAHPNNAQEIADADSHPGSSRVSRAFPIDAIGAVN
jgi:hypothetical protein